MPAAASASSNLAFEIRNARLPVVHMVLRSTDTEQLLQDWQQRFGDMPDFFDQDPLLVDLSALQDQPGVPDLLALSARWQAHRLVPLFFHGGHDAQRQAALDAGLHAVDEMGLQTERSAGVSSVPATPTAAAPVAAQPALVIDRPLRSGQQVYAKGRDLVVLAMVNPGAEVIADGHIHVYAPLRGKAIAGARGNADARIFAQSLEAELVSIAGVYRTSDVPLPEAVRAKAAQVRLDSGPEGDRLLIEPIS